MAIDLDNDFKPSELSLSVCAAGAAGQVAVAFGKRVQLWDVRTGAAEAQLMAGHDAQLDSVACGGGTTAAGCVDGRLLVWQKVRQSTVRLSMN